MSSLAYSKFALRALRRMPPAMVHEIRTRATQSIAAQQLTPTDGDPDIRRLEGQGWRITINAQGTVLSIAQFAT